MLTNLSAIFCIFAPEIKTRTVIILKLKDEIEQLQDENNVLNEELEVVTGGQRERRSHQRKVQDPTIKYNKV